MSTGPIPGSFQSMIGAMEALRRSVGRIHRPMDVTKESVVLFGKALDSASGIVAKFSHYGIGGMHAQMMIQVADMKRNMEVSRRLNDEMLKFAASSIKARDTWKNMDVFVNKTILNFGTSLNQAVRALGNLVDMPFQFTNWIDKQLGGVDFRKSAEGWIRTIFPKGAADKIMKTFEWWGLTADASKRQAIELLKQQNVIRDQLNRGLISRQDAAKKGLNPWFAVLDQQMFNMNDRVAFGDPAAGFFGRTRRNRTRLLQKQFPDGPGLGGAAGGMNRERPRDIKPGEDHRQAQRKAVEADIAKFEKEKQDALAAHDDDAVKSAEYSLKIRRDKLAALKRLNVLIPPGLLGADAMGAHGHNVHRAMGHHPFGPNPFGQGQRGGGMGMGGMFPGMMFPGGMEHSPRKNMQEWEKQLAGGHIGKAVNAMKDAMERDPRDRFRKNIWGNDVGHHLLRRFAQDAIERNRPGGIGRLARMAEAEKMSEKRIEERLKRGGPPTPQEQLQKDMIEKEDKHRQDQKLWQDILIQMEDERRDKQQDIQKQMIEDYDKAAAARQAAGVQHREAIAQQARHLNEAFFARKRAEMHGMADRAMARQQPGHPMAIPHHPLSPMAPISGPSATSAVPAPQAPIKNAQTAPQSWGNK